MALQESEIQRLSDVESLRKHISNLGVESTKTTPQKLRRELRDRLLGARSTRELRSQSRKNPDEIVNVDVIQGDTGPTPEMYENNDDDEMGSGDDEITFARGGLPRDGDVIEKDS